ncbi:short-chain dehydrogenase reductase SDR protein [Rutstroemia sp. NJR-2017a WRK4]|nr:short-chain dehydrogenase reductase SDR protein [Rutstroemia sp. NJR-2017a WRK4]
MSTSTPTPIWFITGSSSGLGLALTLHALRAGHRVIATSRNPSKNPDLVTQVEALGGVWLALDVTSPELDELMSKVVDVYGAVPDVVVNCAGYAAIGAFECFSEQEARAQFDTNFFGPLKICRSVIPAMRERRSGVIVNISSAAGVVSRPSRCLYGSSKFALAGLTESLYYELQPFSVRVLLIEPGAFVTPFAASIQYPAQPIPEDYKDTITDVVIEATKKFADSAPGDTDKGAGVIFDAVMREGAFKDLVNANGKEWLRVPLGSDALRRWREKVNDLEGNFGAMEVVGRSTDREEV